MSRAASPIQRPVAGNPPARRPAGPQIAAEHSLKPRMAVIAPSTTELVRFAGGWLVDQGLAGWEVNVLTADHGDLRPLHILGARGHDLEPVLASPVALGQCLRAVVISADLYDSDARVRRMARNAREARSADVRLWGDVRPTGLGRGGRPVRHRLSLAARAFKAQALAAACIPDEAVTDVEVFRSLSSPVAAA
jgi:hypothetical protein